MLKDIKQKDLKISELIGIVGEKARIGEYKKMRILHLKRELFDKLLHLYYF